MAPTDIIIDTDAPISKEVMDDFRARIGEEASRSKSDHDLLRFLIARNGSLSRAVKMVKDNNECKLILYVLMSLFYESLI